MAHPKMSLIAILSAAGFTAARPTLVEREPSAQPPAVSKVPVPVLPSPMFDWGPEDADEADSDKPHCDEAEQRQAAAAGTPMPSGCSALYEKWRDVHFPGNKCAQGELNLQLRGGWISKDCRAIEEYDNHAALAARGVEPPMSQGTGDFELLVRAEGKGCNPAEYASYAENGGPISSGCEALISKHPKHKISQHLKDKSSPVVRAEIEHTCDPSIFAAYAKKAGPLPAGCDNLTIGPHPDGRQLIYNNEDGSTCDMFVLDKYFKKAGSIPTDCLDQALDREVLNNAQDDSHTVAVEKRLEESKCDPREFLAFARMGGVSDANVDISVPAGCEELGLTHSGSSGSSGSIAYIEHIGRLVTGGKYETCPWYEFAASVNSGFDLSTDCQKLFAPLDKGF